MNINEWAKKHQISPQALADLQAVLYSAVCSSGAVAEGSEAAAQQRIRLEAPHQGVRLWRNNVGACQDANGNHIRYGLANESAAMNRAVKSSDLIGITPLLITADMVGDTVGQFTAIECKRPGWKFKANQHENAQWSFMQLVISMGGRAQFATDPRDVEGWS